MVAQPLQPRFNIGVILHHHGLECRRAFDVVHAVPKTLPPESLPIEGDVLGERSRWPGKRGGGRVWCCSPTHIANCRSLVEGCRCGRQWRMNTCPSSLSEKCTPRMKDGFACL